MACSRRVWSVGSFALWKSSRTSICCHSTERVVLVLEFVTVSWHQKNDKNARQSDSMWDGVTQRMWQHVIQETSEWGYVILGERQFERRLFLQTLLTWLEDDSWSSRVTTKSVISVVNHDKCKSLWQFLGPRLITWYLERLPCKRLLLYQSEMLFPSSVKMLSAWLVVLATENSWRISWYMTQLLVVSWLILTLFFLFVKYDRIRVTELLEKPYAPSLLISRGGYSESNAFDMSVDKTPTTFLLSTACFHHSTNRIRTFHSSDPFDMQSDSC